MLKQSLTQSICPKFGARYVPKSKPKIEEGGRWKFHATFKVETQLHLLFQTSQPSPTNWALNREQRRIRSINFKSKCEKTELNSIFGWFHLMKKRNRQFNEMNFCVGMWNFYNVRMKMGSKKKKMCLLRNKKRVYWR